MVQWYGIPQTIKSLVQALLETNNWYPKVRQLGWPVGKAFFKIFIALAELKKKNCYKKIWVLLKENGY